MQINAEEFQMHTWTLSYSKEIKILQVSHPA